MFTRIELVFSEIFDRHGFVKSELSKITPGSLLDVGAGERPYREHILSLGFSYTSHDFEKYEGSGNFPGLQNAGWENKNHDIVSDILDIPLKKYNVIILTEVLEHVPDPIAALNKCSELLEKNGVLLVTVPFASRMHQAPFWFSAGLSPFWFEHHGPRVGLEIQKSQLLGNFYDMFMVEGQQFFGCFGIRKFNLGKIFYASAGMLRRFLEPRIPNPLLESGALGVFVVLSKN